MSETTTMEKPKLDVLQKEKLKKDQILQVKYQKEFLIEQNKLMRAQNDRTKLLVEEQEISARSWKAFYEKMYFSIECEKLEPLYKEYQERTQTRLEKEKAEYEATQKKLQEDLNAGAGDKISVEAVPELQIAELQKEEE